LPSEDAVLTATPIEKLIRWQWYNADPRAHAGDALDHTHRQFPVHVLLEYRLINSGDGQRQDVDRSIKSLVSKSVSSELMKLGYHRVVEENVMAKLIASCEDRFNKPSFVCASVTT
jgi:hypothetical protein